MHLSTPMQAQDCSYASLPKSQLKPSLLASEACQPRIDLPGVHHLEHQCRALRLLVAPVIDVSLCFWFCLCNIVRPSRCSSMGSDYSSSLEPFLLLSHSAASVLLFPIISSVFPPPPHSSSTPRMQPRYKLKRVHTPIRNVYTSSAPAALSSCTPCIPASTPPSSSSWLFCGRRVSFDRRSRIVCGRSGVYLGLLTKPENWISNGKLSVL